jgi:hypothetical protein
VHRRLSGGIAATNDKHLLSSQRLRLGDGGAVDDPGADQSLQAWNSQPPIRHAARDDDGSSSDPAAVGQPHDAQIGLGGQRNGWTAVDQLNTEQPRLIEGPKGQLRPTDAPRESQIVADQ